VIFNDQDPATRQGAIGLQACLVVGDLGQCHLEDKVAAAARLAVDADRAAHELDEAGADRQPEPRAAVLAARRGIDLGERLGEPLALLGRQSDAGVADAEAQPGGIDLVVDGRDADDDFTLVGELDGVGDQVGEDLR